MVFLVGDETPWSPRWIDGLTGEGGSERKIWELRKQLLQEFLVPLFSSPDELATKVGVAVVRALARRESAPSHEQLRVFLCHASQDKRSVRELYSRLKKDGFDPWLDEENILPGQDWQREIASALHRSDTVLVCLSQASTSKIGFVQKEIKDVLDLADRQPEGAIFIIPLKLEECDVPDRLSARQWVDYFGDHGYERLRLSLEERIKQITPTGHGSGDS